MSNAPTRWTRTATIHVWLVRTAVILGVVSASHFIAIAQDVSAGPPSAQWRKAFARPTGIPHPSGNTQTPSKVALGKRLFSDPRLSGNGKVSCATCHNPQLGFADGVATSQAGATGVKLRRHTPALWNLAWSPLLYWDGRAASLEHQAQFPMSHPDEMAGGPQQAAKRLSSNAVDLRMFRAAFPGETVITGDQVLKVLAAYERTLVSPPTRFDQWIAGDATALSNEEQRGFGLFVGRAQCINCHTGFAFTDFAFHDIGLPGSDLGRGPVIDLPAVNHAFKTPGLRELAWTAPYMHDGSIATLEDVVRHYQQGGMVRSSRSPDMPQPFVLTDQEQADLIAFLEALSSDRAPHPSTEPWIGTTATKVALSHFAIGTNVISQRDKTFRPNAIKLRSGSRLTILNDDTRTHNVRIAHPSLNVNSGAQEPGESVTLTLSKEGRFEAHCAIHPTMRLQIEVTE